MKICPEGHGINSHWDIDTLIEQQISDLEIGPFAKMSSKNLDLLLCETVFPFLVLTPECGSTTNSKILSVAILLSFTTPECKIHYFIKVIYQIIMRKFSVQRTEIVGRNVLSFPSFVCFQKLFDDRSLLFVWKLRTWLKTCL